LPRVHKVEKARKAIPGAGIKVGDPYFWASFKTGPRSSMKRVWRTMPKPSQLTMSEFKSRWREFGERMAELAEDDTLHDALQEIASEIRDLGSEQEDKLSNMPDGLQQASTGELLQERADACANWADEIEGLEQPELEEPEVEDFGERAPSMDDFRDPALTDEERFDELYDAAHEKWEEWKTERDDAVEQAQETYNEALSSLKEDAINADPGEV
jgi:hypothetical protein